MAKKVLKRSSEDAITPFPTEEIVIPKVEEYVTVSKEKRETGGVRVNKTVIREPARVETMLQSEEIEVQRVPINREIKKPAVIREEGNTVIIPVMAEVAVVVKKLMLREEIHLVRRRKQTPDVQEVSLQKEKVEVKRQ